MKKTIFTMMLAGAVLLSSCGKTYPTLETTTKTIPIETTQTTAVSTSQTTSSLFSDISSEQTSDAGSTTTIENTETTAIQTSQSEITTASTASSQTITEITTAEKTTATETTEKPIQPPVTPSVSDEIILGSLGWAIETPSRLLFFHNELGTWTGNTYSFGNALGVCYYSKADGNAYVYCYDPLCSHTNCVQRTFSIEETYLIGNRFYTFDENYNGKTVIRSFGIDGTDMRIDWSQEDSPEIKIGSFNGYGFSEFAYGNYLFAQMTLEDGKKHTLRFDVSNKKMEDLTAKTGNVFMPSFAYGDILYMYSAERKGYIKTDLSLSNITDAESYIQEAFAHQNANGEKTRFIHQIAMGHRMYGTLLTEKANGETESMIQIVDMQEGKVWQIPDSVFGNDAKYVICADDTYIYYLADEPVSIGVNTQNQEIYNDYGGKIYRARLDGSDAECIFSNPEMKFYAGTRAYVSGNDFLIQAAKVTVRDGKSKNYAQGTYIGHFSSNGMLETMTYIDVIS